MNDILDFTLLAETIPHLIFVVRPDLTFAYANSKYLEYTGLTLEAASGDGWKAVLHPDDRSGYEQLVAWALQNLKGIESEVRLKRVDGSYRWHLVKAEPIFGPSKTLQYWVGTCTDVHEKRMITDELRTARERQDLALEDASIAFFDCDIASNQFTCTENYKTWHGGSWPANIPTDALKVWEEFLKALHPEDRERTRETIEKAYLGDAKHYEVEYRTIGPDHSIHWISSRARIMRDERGTAFCIRGVDKEVTDAKETEIALERALKMRDDFLSIASHELKTPLTSIAMQIEVIQSRLFPERDSTYSDARLKDGLGLVARNANRLGKLIEQLLDVARMNSGRLSLSMIEDDLTALITDMVGQMREQIAASGSTISLDLPPTAVAKIDPFRIEQVVVNLLTNALKYGLGKPISIKLRPEPGIWVIEVQDHGRGISESHRARIFERFGRVSSTEGNGLGLGLYIIRQLVEAHGGGVGFTSTPGAGTTFTVSLPREF